MIREFQKLAAPLSRRIRLMVGRAVIRLVDDAAKVQGVQVTLLAGETREAVERFQEYGFTSHPHAGAEAVMVSVSGNRDHGIVIAVEDRRYRLTGLAAGEVALYDDLGHIVKLSRTGIQIVGGGHNIAISGAPQVVVSGGDVIADGISLKSHKHGGVQPGSGDTGVPHP